MFSHTKTPIRRSETLEELLKKYPIHQWWRLFIDGYCQYSQINRELDENEKLHAEKLWTTAACESFDVGHSPTKIAEKEYMKLALYAFFSLLDKIYMPLTIDLIKYTHHKVTNDLQGNDASILKNQFNPGETHDETTMGGFCLFHTKSNEEVTTTPNGLKELKAQEEMLGIKYFSGQEEKKSRFSHYYKNFPFVTVYPCSSLKVEERIEAIITNYETKIVTEYHIKNKLVLITDMIQKLERLHPFQDGNCRTFCMLLLNKELLRHKMYPTILFNPNTFEGFSLKEMVQEIMEGQMRFIHILNNTANKNATLTFKLSPYPDVVQPYHVKTPPFIQLNDYEKETSLNFVEQALAKLKLSNRSLKNHRFYQLLIHCLHESKQNGDVLPVSPEYENDNLQHDDSYKKNKCNVM